MAAEDDDDRLFAEAMKGVRPLPAGPARVPPGGTRRTTRSMLVSPTPGPGLEVLERWGETHALAAPGTDRRLLKEMRSGARPPEASLDLHGLSADRAMATFGAFLARALAAGHRCVLVIHGRGRGSGAGGPVLRDRLLDALAGGEVAEVLAATNAPPALGGSGASLLLLRRRR